MTTRVDFYVLADSDESRRRLFVCRLVDKAWRLGHRIRIQSPDPGHLAALDELLWTYDQGSFLPHERVDAASADPDCPVILATDDSPASACDVLINEGTDAPSAFTGYDRIAEVVNQDAATRDAGRRRYVQYRDQGAELHHHEVK